LVIRFLYHPVVRWCLGFCRAGRNPELGGFDVVLGGPLRFATFMSVA
jgi:hypothetical protein